MKNPFAGIGLALGGGAVLGGAHIGVLRALDEAEIPIHFVAGTSVGALIGALYAGGLSWREMESMALDMNWFDVSRVRLSRFGLLSNRKIGNIVKEHLGEMGFADTRIPLAMVATDISSGEKVVLHSGDLARAVMASTCVPGVFVPVEIDGRMLVDGGVVENVPLSPLQEMGAGYILGVDLNAKIECRRPRNIVEVLLKTFDFMLLNATRLQTERADYMIAPDLSRFNMINTYRIGELIDVGYRDASAALRQLSAQYGL